jgi:hypothetical protein
MRQIAEQSFGQAWTLKQRRGGPRRQKLGAQEKCR